MVRAISKRIFVAMLALAAACARTIPTDPPSTTLPAPAPSASSAAPAASSAAPASASASAFASSPPPAPDGPHELPLAPGRSIFYALPGAPSSKPGARPWRLVGHLHGICYPPSYSAGRWLAAAASIGVLVSPTGNARCGDPNIGPPSWEAPTWEELVAIMDADLERSIAKVETKHPGSTRRDGAVLTGFSRGAYAAPVIARMHPGRWPYLVLIEANVPLSAASLRKAGVRAVALLAGEVGTEIAGERKTEAELAQAGFPVRLFVMPRVAHLYPDDMDGLMRDAFDFVLSHEH